MINDLTQEQKRLLAYVKSLCGANPVFADLFYQGAIAGAEFLTYSAKKLYLAFEISFSYSTATPNNNFGIINFYNEANNNFFNLTNESINYNGTAAADRSVNNNCIAYNLYFSRMGYNNYTYMKFNGIKVTWP